MDYGQIEARLDALTQPLLMPLRATKSIDGSALADLLALGPDLIATVSKEPLVPASVVGKCWFVFTGMLAEADHAAEPEPILNAAWQWQEMLRRAFGPLF